jgi:hypothetical protein
MTDDGPGSERPSRSVDGRIVLLVDIFVVAALLALLAFAPLAHLAAPAQPRPPNEEPRLPALTGNPPIVWCGTCLVACRTGLAQTARQICRPSPARC